MDYQKVPFNKLFLTGYEASNIAEAHANSRLAGDGLFTQKCHAWLRSYTGGNAALLTNSCTAALEMSALLLDIQPGDEIIMPSYTFVSTANSFVLRGAVPVFVDIRADTFNLDETLIEAAITPRTKAIVPVHYAGVGCEMDSILQIAQRYGLRVVEDAAQGIMSRYKDRPLGSLGDLAAYSFHETKNVISGEGGALVVRDAELVAKAEIIREKGTDRSRFCRGQVDKYTWQDLGSSFLPGELTAAFLWAQLQSAQSITSERLSIWNKYHVLLKDLETAGHVRRPIIPESCQHNAHMYYIVLREGLDRDSILEGLRERGIEALFHYIPLHSSPAGLRYARSSGELPITVSNSQRLVRLPMWIGLTDSQQEYVVKQLGHVIQASKAPCMCA